MKFGRNKLKTTANKTLINEILPLGIHNLHICTHNRTQYKQLHTKFIHLLHKVGVGTSQDGTSITSNKCMTEAKCGI